MREVLVPDTAGRVGERLRNLIRPDLPDTAFVDDDMPGSSPCTAGQTLRFITSRGEVYPSENIPIGFVRFVRFAPDLSIG
jgi:MoaA/NifB/PqqE/SkfB family radical SAM enzyme